MGNITVVSSLLGYDGARLPPVPPLAHRLGYLLIMLLVLGIIWFVVGDRTGSECEAGVKKRMRSLLFGRRKT